MFACLAVGCAPGMEPEPFLPDTAVPVAEGAYAYDFQRECFCVEEAREPVRITVADDAVVEVRSRGSGTLLPTDSWPTLRQIEREVDAARERSEEVVIERDAGEFPVRVAIGSMAADAGVVYHLGNLERID